MPHLMDVNFRIGMRNKCPRGRWNKQDKYRQDREVHLLPFCDSRSDFNSLHC